MDVFSQDPQYLPMDLSKSYNSRNRGHPEVMDLAKKPEWYHRRPAGTDLPSPFRSRASSSYGSPAHRRDLEQSTETLGNYMNSSGLDLYHDRVHSNLWHTGFYGGDQRGVPESSGGEESDSGSDVIFLLSSAKEPMVCGSFIQDDVRRMVEPTEAGSCYLLPQQMSSPSPESSYSEESSDSSLDIPIHHSRPIVLLADLNSVYNNQPESVIDVSSDDSDLIHVTTVNDKKKSKKKIPSQFTGKQAVSSKVRRSNRSKKLVSETPTPAFSVRSPRHSLQRRAKRDAVGIYNENSDSDSLMEYALRLSSFEESNSQPNPPQRVGGNAEESGGVAESDRKLRRREPCRRNALTRDTAPTPPSRTLRKNKQIESPPTTSSTTPTKKPQRKRPARRRRKRCGNFGPSSLFPPTEPEIKLRILQTKEKKERRSDSFCPFVHLNKRTCQVVNYQEDEAKVRSSDGEGRVTTPSGFVPTTSCYKLGRLGPDSDAMLCCLCGQMANVTGLGDLHGPYRPASSHLDAQSQETHTLSNGCLEEENNERNSPSFTEEPLHFDECWVHEDCGIWSAGVFLVRGKLYGLEEAARLAREAVCSSCQQTGAIIGCFQKGCSSNFHYTCAIQSGCVLNEENFSLRCPDHKIKPLTVVTRKHKR